MSLSKAGLFGEREVALAEFAGSLSHPARIAVVMLLMERGSMSCSAIVSELPLAQPTVSQHLKALERVGLVESRRDGVTVYYRLESERLKSFCHAFQQALGTGENNERGNGR